MPSRTLDGGLKTYKDVAAFWKVQLFELNLASQELEAVSGVIRRAWITMGKETKAFEAAFARFPGAVATCPGVSSGTAALHVGLLAASVGPGVDIVVPALPLVAGVNGMRLVRAIPIPVDATSLEDWNISPADRDSGRQYQEGLSGFP